jgi:hypothetical protein
MVQKLATLCKSHEEVIFRNAAAEIAKISVVFIDSVQGTQSSWVTMDTVRSDSLGFLKSTNRMVVGISRACDGLIVIGNSRRLESAYIEKGREYMDSPLGKIVSYCKDNEMFFPQDPDWTIPALERELHQRQ